MLTGSVPRTDSCRGRSASLFLPLIFLSHCFGLIPASCSFAGLCFPGSALNNSIGFPSIKQPLALEAEAFAFGCPRKWGRKRRHFHVLLMLSGIALGCGSLADVPVIRARVVSPWPLTERRPATP